MRRFQGRVTAGDGKTRKMMPVAIQTTKGVTVDSESEWPRQQHTPLRLEIRNSEVEPECQALGASLRSDRDFILGWRSNKRQVKRQVSY
jgi:hypothetical protein